MPEVFFCAADGTRAVPADADAIRRLMMERGEDYWNDPEGSGFAELTVYPDGQAGECAAKLVLTKSDRHGFHFWADFPVADLRSPYHRDLESYYSCSDQDLKDWLTVGDSHEGRRPIFTGLFVPAAAAVEEVREFIRSGGLSDRVRWVTGDAVVEAKRRHGLA